MNDLELYHRSHKYTKKWFKNGRWHYYYGYTSNKNVIERVQDKLGFDERQNYNTAKKHSQSDYETLTNAIFLKSNPEYQSENTQDYINRAINDYKENYNYSSSLTNSYLEAYKKTPLYKIEKSIDKGKSFLKKLFGR